ncbi:50S ribosomal protein L3 N(5)-glutamine methyltransferase [Paenalcaligenes faecalis]|uniref:50S ribosomal protein L3 N(5)-glutamine methyltransferase n=1 Tax=Paenalcaligenes faecalis TaxID=2980099 RepID=UPI0022B983A9|nr:50S ribosomal protein L3 N(5)-glutamine methyltransferase [Paenalcaligenes faecalis]
MPTLPSAYTEAAQELRTLRDLLRWAISQFERHQLQFGHGSDNAWDEAIYLLLHSLNLPLDRLEPFLDAGTTQSERLHFVQLIQRRCEERLPAAYLTGEAWLQGLRFKVSPDCIVPRSPISELLSTQLAPWIEDPSRIESVLDVCTGSGCLAILAALTFPNATVDGVDISAAALAIAKQNIEDYGLEDRVCALNSDLYSAVSDKKYDIIISNPPYVNEDSMQALPAEYKHEPRLALAGGEDGMDLVRTILAQAADHLNDNGILILEIGNEYDHFCTAFPELEPIWLSTETADDQILLLHKEQLLNR